MEKPFQFKQFAVYHQQSTLKVGTDAILLGAWADTKKTTKILEIGSGCGIIALMLAQRCNADIDTIDIDSNSCNEARKNFGLSPWGKRIKVTNISFQDFCKNNKNQFDLIVSNPPYFSNSLKSSDIIKNLAKHNDSLGFKELVLGLSKLLLPEGKACIILPINEALKFKEEAFNQQLFCNHEVEIIPDTGKPIMRLLMQFAKTKTITKKEQLIILNENKNYTNEFIDLTREFYLAF